MSAPTINQMIQVIRYEYHTPNVVSGVVKKICMDKAVADEVNAG